MKNKTLKLWILSKMRYWKCEFCENWDFKNVNFWIKCWFLSLCGLPTCSVSLTLKSCCNFSTFRSKSSHFSCTFCFSREIEATFDRSSSTLNEKYRYRPLFCRTKLKTSPNLPHDFDIFPHILRSHPNCYLLHEHNSAAHVATLFWLTKKCPKK